MSMVMKDGHIHSPFCPHGTKDKMSDYVEKAIELGYEEITFTEHAPLPIGFKDPTPDKDSAMRHEDLQPYLNEIRDIQQFYHKVIKVNAGLEVDFIEGFEEKTKQFLNEVGPQLDDAILSVHFLKRDSEYECLDYSPEVFEKMIFQYGTLEKVYLKYFETLKRSINAELGVFKPKRIGHITLVKKFQKKFPPKHDFELEVLEVLKQIKEKGYELDYNGAGIAKPLCRETYPPLWVINKARTLQIPLVYGSDAHQIKELNQGKDSISIF